MPKKKIIGISPPEIQDQKRLRAYLRFYKKERNASQNSPEIPLRRFLKWLATHEIYLDGLTKADLGKYEIELTSLSLKWRLIRGKVRTIQCFLTWLINNDLLKKKKKELGLLKVGDAITSQYLLSAGKYWGYDARHANRIRINKFNKWLDACGILVGDITFEDLQAYKAYLNGPGIGEYSSTQYMSSIHHYLRWLSVQKVLKTSLVDLGLELKKYRLLQEHHEEATFAGTKKKLRGDVRLFYEWLEKRNIPIEDLCQDDMTLFKQHLRQSLGPTKTSLNKRLRINQCVSFHLHWLIDKGHLKRTAAELELLKKKHESLPPTLLPKQAVKFLDIAIAHKRPNTILHYQTRLKHFHRFLEERQLSLSTLTRLDLEEFMRHMHDQGYAPQSRRHAIGVVQVYLSWLYECRFLKKDPESMITNFPRPKLPDRLPRALPTNVDKLFQSLLSKNDDVIYLALLLMRRTGIRIGDLRNLPYQCVFDDPKGNNYLKVPVGKLHNERLVPLDKETLDILLCVQKKSLEHNGGKVPTALVIHPRGRPPGLHDYHLALYDMEEVIKLDNNLSLGDESLQSHRLRHTHATSLLSAGMGIEGVKEILGHRSINMSLVYAKVTPTKLYEDYLMAMEKVESKYKLPEMRHKHLEQSTEGALHLVLSFLRGKAKGKDTDQNRLKSIIRRAERLRKDLLKIK